ncbi:hypothetical protein HGRIS_008386 [Hohenbuehelia grisea]|uniref:SYO1-like TPR repeats domain-containing protein n=1 Tax=Hohenbuehelia grisea TaxID=104357 RepID=A0ABR3J863_9AGAR
MGKAQKKRAMRRHNPMRVPDSHLPKGLASASSTSSKSQEILPILQKMESTDAAERKWACVAVSNIIHNDPSTRRLLQGKNVVGALIARLTDAEEEVVMEAMGSLRNLCIDGGYDICAEMYNKNILTPLKAFVPKISEVLAQYLTSPNSAPENARQAVYEFSDNVITTLWCLSETSNKALAAINAINLVPFLMSFLAAHQKLSITPVVAAAHCLYVLTDDNPPATSEVRSDAGYLSTLLSIIQSDHSAPNGKAKEDPDCRSVTLRVLCSGILRNISPLPPPAAISSVDIDKTVVLPLLLSVISSVSLSDASNTVQQVVARQESEIKMEDLSLKHTPKSDHKSDDEKHLERIETTLRTVQLALEILTGMCATLPDPGPDGEDDEVEAEADDDESIDGDAEVPEDGDMAVDTADSSSKPASSSLHSLIPSLLTLIQPVTLSFPPLASQSMHPPTTSVLSAIHNSAVECLNNIFLSLSTGSSTLSMDQQSGLKAWTDVWTALSVVGTEFGPGQERRKEMWDNAVGVLWGIGNVWKGVLPANEEQVRVLMQYLEANSDPRTQVKCIGTLECLAQHPESVQGNQVISSYLISLLPGGSAGGKIGTEPLIQAVSALIDIYSDENMPYDVNFRSGGYLQKLDASIDGFKKAVKAIDRKKEGGLDLRRRGDEVGQNLLAFVNYRRALRL